MMRSKRRLFRALASAVLTAAAVSLASCGGGSSSTTSTTQKPVAKVAVNPSSATIPLNSQQTFAAVVTDSAGNAITNLLVTWSSSSANIATINSNGVATAVSTGPVKITASVTDPTQNPAKVVTSDPATLTITPVVASVTVQPASPPGLPVGQTLQFTASVLDHNGNPISGVAVAWQSSFANVATIDAKGVATGVSPGTVTIVATAQGVQSQPVALTVQ